MMAELLKIEDLHPNDVDLAYVVFQYTTTSNMLFLGHTIRLGGSLGIYIR